MTCFRNDGVDALVVRDKTSPLYRHNLQSDMKKIVNARISISVVLL